MITTNWLMGTVVGLESRSEFRGEYVLARLQVKGHLNNTISQAAYEDEIIQLSDWVREMSQ